MTIHGRDTSPSLPCCRTLPTCESSSRDLGLLLVKSSEVAEGNVEEARPTFVTSARLPQLHNPILISRLSYFARVHPRYLFSGPMLKYLLLSRFGVWRAMCGLILD
ncbi:unnamed protein product [Ectocarpus sp. 12 AP-2014]